MDLETGCAPFSSTRVKSHPKDFWKNIKIKSGKHLVRTNLSFVKYLLRDENNPGMLGQYAKRPLILNINLDWITRRNVQFFFFFYQSLS